MSLTAERLTVLIEDMAEEARFTQEETDPNEPEEVEFLAMVQDCFAALRELQAWRQAYPGVVMGLVYASPYGVQVLQ